MTYRPKMQFQTPANWPDFEDLCWDLWKTIWKDPGTKKHGRSGQAQHGVDIYGNPNNNNLLAGVQCKGKENFTGKQLTKKELLAEVEKAKKFSPALSEFIIATTAPRDAKIQAVVRNVNEQHKAAKLFSVSVCAWNDIEDLMCKRRLKSAAGGGPKVQHFSR